MSPLSGTARGASLRWAFSEAYVARPISEAAVEAHLAPMRRPDIDGAVRPLLRGMVLPEPVRMVRGVYRRRRLTVPTLVVFGRRDWPYTEELMRRICSQSGAVRRSRRVRLRRLRSAFHHR